MFAGSYEDMIRASCSNYEQFKAHFFRRFLGTQARRNVWIELDSGSYSRADTGISMAKYFSNYCAKRRLLGEFAPTEVDFIERISYHLPGNMGAQIRRIGVGENALEEVLQYLERQDSGSTRRFTPRPQPHSDTAQPGNQNPNGNGNRGGQNGPFNMNNRSPGARPANVRDINLIFEDEEEEGNEEEVKTIRHIVSSGAELLEESNLDEFTRKSSPKVLGNLGSLSVEFLIDTGSEISLISEDLFESLKENSEVHAKHEGQLTMAGPFSNSKKNKSLAQVLVKLTLGDSSFLCVFVVSPLKDRRLAIIGDNVLIKHEFVVDFRHKLVQWTSNARIHELPFILEDSEGEYTVTKIEVESRDVPSKIEEKLNQTARESNLTTEQVDSLRQVLIKHRGVFQEKPGRTDEYVHEIHCRDETPFYQRPFPIPLAYQDQVKEDINQMLEWGVIAKAATPYVSPIFMLKKADGSVRYCVDF
jgi:hypothetical protein